MEKYYIDIHCHPSLKPFGKSFKKRITTGENSADPNDTNSIWYTEKPKLFKKVLNVFLRLTKWRQSDFSSILKGNGKVIITSLYPMEKGVVMHSDKKNVKLIGRLLRNLVIGIGMRRIQHIQNMEDYFVDLLNEYDYYIQLHETSVNINGVNKTYKLVKSVSEIDYSKENTLHVIMSIEGAHVFNSGLQLAGKPVADKTEVLKNVKIVKNWDFKPLFIGLAHHFDNELCGFSKSFSGIVSKLFNQNADKDQGITPIGKDVIIELLNNEDGKRIFIDLKHMNPKSRYEYYNLVDTKYKDENIPLIVSHGALNGKLHHETHNKVWEIGFNTDDINFYFDEIQRIEKSKGIFGIQLDERRIFNSKSITAIFKKASKNMTKYGRRKLRKNSYFIWRQIEHIARYLDALGRNAWDIQTLGTDFDGIIDPLNGWWSARELRYLDDYLLHHAQDFLRSQHGKKLKSQNQLDAQIIVEKFMYGNAKHFIATFF